ncbi:MAG: phenylalanyl-tRNA synthetase subunit [Bacteroidetes bacterium]|jgi:phage shock protein A|nr:MAG: phenylalanyl-tRNA synthetase subunit [Bacteroidota bacterium]
MTSAETLTSGIEYKVRKLLEKCNALKAENEKLNQEAKALNARIENLKANVSELENKLIVVKLAKTLNKEESRTNVKLKINELVRDIDRCIGLLNK